MRNRGKSAGYVPSEHIIACRYLLEVKDISVVDVFPSQAYEWFR